MGNIIEKYGEKYFGDDTSDESESDSSSESGSNSNSSDSSVSSSNDTSSESDSSDELSLSEGLSEKPKYASDGDNCKSRTRSNTSSYGENKSSCKSSGFSWTHRPQSRNMHDPSVIYFREKMGIDFKLKPLKLPKSSRDKVELETLPFEWLDSEKPYSPILVEMKNKEGKTITARRICGFRELLNKRDIIQAFKEQEEISEESQPGFGSDASKLKNDDWMWTCGGIGEGKIYVNSQDAQVFQVCNLLTDGGRKKRKKKFRRKRVARKATAGSKSGRSTATKSTISGGGQRRNSSIKRRKSTASKNSGRKSILTKKKAPAAAAVAQAGRREMITPKNVVVSKGILKTKNNTGGVESNSIKTKSILKTENPKKVTSKSKKGAPGDDYTKPTVSTLAKKTSIIKITSATKKNSKTVNPKKQSLEMSEDTRSRKQILETKSKRESFDKSNDKKRNSLLDQSQADPKNQKSTAVVNEKVNESKAIKKSKTKKTLVKPSLKNTDKMEDENNGRARTVTFAEPEKKHRQRERRPTLTAEEIEAVRLHELHLERDAEWLELSASDKEEEDVLRTETFGKEKLKWMNKELSYESQLLNRELQLYTKMMSITGRQPFHGKSDLELGVIQYRIDRRRQIPFAISSLFLWISTVFILQGYIDVSTTVPNADDTNTYTTKVEAIELQKYNILFFVFMINLILASLWSVTVLLKDGLFICQYMNALMASLTQMEVTGAKGLRDMTKCNYILVLIYAIVLSSAFANNSPTTVRGTSGLISMLLCRVFIQDIRLKPQYIFYQIFGLVFHIYVIFCSRGIMVFMQLMASVLRQAAEKWNFKFGSTFGQFGIRSRGQLIRLKLNQSFVKIFVHHRYIIGLTSLYGRVFATPIALYFLLELTAFTYYLIYIYRYRQGTPEAHELTGGEFYQHNDTLNTTTSISNYNSKMDDYITTFWAIMVMLIDFFFTSESIAAAGRSVIAGFQFVRRRGQILCETSHERRLITSLQWSFSATSPAVINVNGFFEVNRPNIIAGLGTALLMFSLIIQLNQEKTSLEITQQPCGFNADLKEQFCFVTKRVPIQPTFATPRPSTTPVPLIVNIQEDPHVTYFWFWNDCKNTTITRLDSTSTLQFNFSSNLPICHKKIHKGDISLLPKIYPKYHVNEETFDKMKEAWKLRNNGTRFLKTLGNSNCINSSWETRLENNFQACYSRITQKYLILQDVYVCPWPECPPVWLRGLRNNSDCNTNPYPISPFFTNNTNNGTTLIFIETNIANTTGLTRLGYFDCTGKEWDTIESRDDCGWIPFSRLEDDDIPIRVNIIPGELIPIPDTRLNLNTTKWCYSHNIDRCNISDGTNLTDYCPWTNFESRGYEKYVDGVMYGADCYNSSFFFNFKNTLLPIGSVENKAFGFCNRRIPEILLENDTRFFTEEDKNRAKLVWNNNNRPDLRPCITPTCDVGTYNFNRPPCQTISTRYGEVGAFYQARDFRRPCRNRNGTILTFIDDLYVFNNNVSSPFRNNRPVNFSCYDKPYNNINSVQLFDCWGEEVILDQCDFTEQGIYVGDFYRRKDVRRHLRNQIYILLQVRLPSLTNVTRRCWNSEFALQRCNDPNIACTRDRHPHIRNIMYGDQCIRSKITQDIFGGCELNIPLNDTDSITLFFPNFYTNTRAQTWLMPRSTRFPSRNCIKDLASWENTTWVCDENPDFFQDFMTTHNQTNYTRFPCETKRDNRTECLSERLCQLINPMREALHFRTPCRDENGTVRAMIPRLIFRIKLDVAPATEGRPNETFWNLTFVNMESLRFAASRLNCYENPFVGRDGELIWSRLDGPVFTCWGEQVNLTTIDDCGSFPFERFATGFRPPSELQDKKTIFVNITYLENKTRIATRTCFIDVFSIERCEDPLIRCKNDIPIVLFAYGDDCRKQNLDDPKIVDQFGACFLESDLLEMKNDNITFFLSQYYLSARNKTWLDPVNGEFHIDNCTKPGVSFNATLNTTANILKCEEQLGFFPDFISINDTGAHRLFPCVHKRKEAAMAECQNELLDDQRCRHINPMVEALNFRIPCRDRIGIVRAMIPRILTTDWSTKCRPNPCSSAQQIEFRNFIPLSTVPLEEIREAAGLSCWENTYVHLNFSFLLNTTLTEYFRNTTENIMPGMFTCWGQNLTNLEEQLDHCGWIPFERFPSGNTPFDFSSLETVNVTVELIINGTLKNIRRNCWNDAVALERCNDPSFRCKFDIPLLFVAYGNDCENRSLPLDEFGICIIESGGPFRPHIPENAINVTFITFDHYMEIRRETWDNPDGNYILDNCPRNPTQPNPNWDCDDEPGKFSDIWSDGNTQKYRSYPCAEKHVDRLPFSRFNCSNTERCVHMNPIIEALNFRLPCRDQNGQLRAMIPRFLWIDSRIPSGMRRYFEIHSVPIEVERNRLGVSCWDNPYLSPTFTTYLWQGTNPNSEIVRSRIATCWNTEAITIGSAFDDCGWYPFRKFATGERIEMISIFRRADTNVTINFRGLSINTVRSCWQDPLSLERCNDPDLRCKNDLTQTSNTYMYGEDCITRTFRINEFGVCNESLPTRLQDQVTYFSVNTSNHGIARSWGTIQAESDTIANDPRCSTPACLNVVAKYNSIVDNGLGHPCEFRRNDSRCATSDCIYMNPMVEAITFRIPCRDTRGRVRMMIPRLMYTFTTNNGSNPNRRRLSTVFLDTFRSTTTPRLSCWNKLYTNILNNRFEFLWKDGRAAVTAILRPTNTTASFGIRDRVTVNTCWGLEITLGLLDECGWFPYGGEFATGRPPVIPTTKSLVTLSLTRMNSTTRLNITRQVQRLCYDDFIGGQRCRDPDLQCLRDLTFF